MIKTLELVLDGLPDQQLRLIKPVNSREIAESCFGALLPSDPTPDDDVANTAGNGFFGARMWWQNSATNDVWYCLTGFPAGAALWVKIYPVSVPSATELIDGDNTTVIESPPGTWQVNVSSYPASDIAGTLTKSQISDTGAWEVSEIPDLPASKTTSGTFDVARIPDLPASKTTSGTFDIARIPAIPATSIGSGALPAGVTISATQLTTGALPAGVTIAYTSITSPPTVPPARVEDIAITATGTNQATAYAIQSWSNNNVTSVPGGTGVRLPAGQTGDMVFVYNNTGSPLQHYPHSGGNFKGSATNAGLGFAGPRGIFFVRLGNEWSYSFGGWT